MTRPSDLRVLSLLVRPSPALFAANAAIVVWAGYLAVTAPEDLRGPYVVLLLLQAFTASSGYAARARRGYFDQLLAGRADRRTFALAHAVVSIGLGISTWIIVSMIDALGGAVHWPLGLTPRALAAVVYISLTAWAFSVPFSKYAAGVVWLLAAIVLAGSGKLLDIRMAYAGAVNVSDGLAHALPAALVFPPFLVGEPSTPPWVVTGVVLVAAVIALVGGAVFIARTDVPLEDAE